MGSNLAVLLNEGYAHFWLHSANVTMAAELVDMETLFHWKQAKNPATANEYSGVRRAHLKDMRDAAYCMWQLIAALGISRGTNAGQASYEFFMDGYTRTAKPNVQEAQKTDSANAAAWMDRIMRAVLVERRRLAPLNKNDIADWNIAP